MIVKAHFILDTPCKIFLNWLEQHTQLWYMTYKWPIQAQRQPDSPLSDRGELRLVGGTRSTPRGEFTIDGFTAYPYKDRSAELASPIFPVIKFQTIPLSTERCKVSATCFSEPLEGRFEALLQDIAEHWPELRLLGEEKGREQEAGLAGIQGETDRKIVHMWREGATSAVIASVIGYSEGHARNKITALRKQYGKEVVPLRRVGSNDKNIT